jgi:transposase
MERARIEVLRPRWACRECGSTLTEEVPFRAPGQRITLLLLAFVCDLPALGQTLKAVSLITGLNKNVVKKIDRARFSGLYTEGDEDGETRLRKPKRQARYLGADKFKLHNRHRYATVVIDLKMGHVLWLAYSKRKQVAHEFCDFVLAEWISNVEAIACDMNADFERAFLKRFLHLDIVYEYFHLIKNFNEKVICKVRKDKQARLKDEGNVEAACAPQALQVYPHVLCGDQEEEGARCTRRQGRLKGKRPLRQAGGPAEGRGQEALRGAHIPKRAACYLRHCR